MNNNYLNFASGEVTIYCGENARSNSEESLRQAAAISQHNRKAKILYINTFLSTRKILAAAREQHADTGSNITYMNIAIGELSNSLWNISELITKEKITCIIINSWEFAHKSYIYKERAIFELMGLINKTDVSLLVYSQAKLAEPGKIQRGGLGKLSALASAIIPLAPVKEISIPEENPTPKTGEIKKLDALKINELDYARSGSEVSSGGELLLPDEAMVLEEELMAV